MIKILNNKLILKYLKLEKKLSNQQYYIHFQQQNFIQLKYLIQQVHKYNFLLELIINKLYLCHTK
jgi:hypothetical protein